MTMSKSIENRRYWDTPTKAILSTLLLSLTLLTAVSIIPLTLKQVKNNQETQIKADTIYTTPLITPISSDQVVISFSTKIPVTSQLNLISPTERTVLSVSNDPQTSHAITLENLKPQTNYTFNLILNPVNQDTITTNDHNFTTP
ncbi:hypothetical protein KJ953_00590 [Patescibacteria group bacterium]|nr:hypothetical protein [Patescibacteria group bacterium]MBU1256484.1 hypothetical protein [Patescibacteria group bacterium]MBU1457558.1 hypothetical protein [Patescibacteria group bacterium]